jgi:hypothetical protein
VLIFFILVSNNTSELGVRVGVGVGININKPLTR